ncbi:MAG: CDP-alcohol phosphatidyltransferase family protein [Deltaproteobacteria bacterium]|nr:CDP-alcohol phosphatidyltransferase family protein [Deltaproteobacteria bacterium]
MANIPNILTLFRILLVPLFLFLVAEDNFFFATIVFAVAGITDAVDGFIARAYNLRTELGANLDPFADKLLLVSSYIILTAKGLIPLWLCVPVILRDAVILTGVIILRGAGRKVVISPTIFGKITTTLQIATVIYALVFAGTGRAFFVALAAVTALITVYTGFDYAWREFKIQLRGGAE